MTDSEIVRKLVEEAPSWTDIPEIVGPKDAKGKIASEDWPYYNGSFVLIRRIQKRIIDFEGEIDKFSARSTLPIASAYLKGVQPKLDKKKFGTFYAGNWKKVKCPEGMRPFGNACMKAEEMPHYGISYPGDIAYIAMFLSQGNHKVRILLPVEKLKQVLKPEISKQTVSSAIHVLMDLEIIKRVREASFTKHRSAEYVYDKKKHDAYLKELGDERKKAGE